MSRIRSLEELVRDHHRLISKAFQALQDDLAAHQKTSRELDPDDEDYQYYALNVSNHIHELKSHVEGTLSVWDGTN